MIRSDEKIDFVITYLDGNDIAWQEEKNRYNPGEKADINPNRYRNWDNLKYFFRGLDKFAPWMNRLHFVTWGHIPDWLDCDHPKINIVKHEDYIPTQWLPTFSSRCIDMNLHRIPGISEKFVYFNDDMFLTNETKQEDFFVNGLPCDSAILTASSYKMKNKIGDIHLAPVVDCAVINKHFDRKIVMKRDRSKWYNLKYGKFNLVTMLMFPYSGFVGFMNFHLPYSYLRSSYEEVWEKELGVCETACSHKFRDTADANHWLFTYWQYAKGEFSPRTPNVGRCFQLHSIEDSLSASKAIAGRKYKMICLNDSLDNNADFEQIKENVNTALNNLFPEKSQFEK